MISVCLGLILGLFQPLSASPPPAAWVSLYAYRTHNPLIFLTQVARQHHLQKLVEQFLSDCRVSRSTAFPSKPHNRQGPQSERAPFIPLHSIPSHPRQPYDPPSLDRTGSAPYPNGSRSSHSMASVASATSGTLRCTSPLASNHPCCAYTFPDPAPPSQRRERMALPGLSFHRIPGCVPFQTPHTPILPAGELLSFRSVPELRRHFTRSPANALIRNLRCGNAR